MLLFVHLSIFGSLWSLPTAAFQTPFEPMHHEPLLSPQLKTRIQDILDDWKSSDFILAVTKKQEDGTFREEYASFGRNAYDPQSTMFSIASNTKQFTALTVALLMEDEAVKDRFPLGWRTPLKSVLPDFKLADPADTEHLTLGDALSHLSGLPRHDLLPGDVAKHGREVMRVSCTSLVAQTELSG
jgi:CubicO group peptidase (beta-lactamase class C family)